MKALGIIPARYWSTRFPGKPLAPISGKPMIQRVYEQAVKAKKLTDVIVATDDDRIVECIEEFGGKYVMTESNIKTGTERVAAAAESIEADIILNIQGDEPLVPPEILDQLVETMISDTDIPVCTPVTKITSENDLSDPNQARVIFDNKDNALYFTRAAVPFNRDESDFKDWLSNGTYWKHIGIYCFRRDFLYKFVEMSEGRLEKIEKLEQLRILENGYQTKVVRTDYSPVCVDVPKDIKKVEKILDNS
ncbi:3-deoxy-manno-octulosonate cytidylyltransferase [candidate division KSB1 bacterium]